MIRQLRRFAAMTAILAAAGSSPALAWEQLNLETTPSGKVTLNDLPGVELNRGAQKSTNGDCTQDRYFSAAKPGFDNGGTVTNCDFGNFSLRTYKSGSSPTLNDKLFPVPGPLSNDGPPPGSGGYAPRKRW